MIGAIALIRIDSILPLVGSIAGIGLLSMALIQTLRLLIPIRGLFHRRKVRAWMMKTDPEGTWPEADLLRLLGSSSKLAFYDLPIEQLCGQIGAASDQMLAYPGQYSRLLDLLSGQTEEGQADKRNIGKNSDRGARRERIGRRIDALQISTAAAWKRWLRCANIIISSAIAFTAAKANVAVQVEPAVRAKIPVPAEPCLWTLLMGSLIAGFVAAFSGIGLSRHRCDHRKVEGDMNSLRDAARKIVIQWRAGSLEILPAPEYTYVGFARTIILLIHGYNSDPDEASAGYRELRNALRSLGIDQRILDCIWDVYWPGYLPKGEWNWWHASFGEVLSKSAYPVMAQRTRRVGKAIARHLMGVVAAGGHPPDVVLIGHSLGCRLILEILRKMGSQNRIPGICLMAAAVPVAMVNPKEVLEACGPDRRKAIRDVFCLRQSVAVRLSVRATGARSCREVWQPYGLLEGRRIRQCC